MKNDPGVLFFFDHFFPAYKSGGPGRSSLALVEKLQEYLPVFVITRSKDLNESKNLIGIKINEWNKLKKAKILYLTNINFSTKLIRHVRSLYFCAYHFNSLFSFRFSILPLFLIQVGALPRRRIILSPRGECSDIALAIKPLKKKLYLFVFRVISRNKIIYHATTESEKSDIIKNLSVKEQDIFIASNLRSETDSITQFSPSVKQAGLLKIAFISRIAPIKNIEYCFEVLKQVKGDIIFDCYGTIEDKSYFQMILTASKKLPFNISFKFCGPLNPENVVATISRYDLLFLPSKSENFGHIILDAFIASRPVLISDRTFWQSLQSYSCGWSIPLVNQNKYIETIEELIPKNNIEFDHLSKGAYNMAKKYFDEHNNSYVYLNKYKEKY